MPFVHVRYAAKSDDATEEALIRDITAAVLTHLPVPVESVSVVLEPVPSSRWGVGGTPLSSHGV
ncbi:tautomerase family protein [Capillimicrobium parvum]|uniref:4-oxalocrotonate tautomerase-like domain-containing protein n=1 Tax=Capillimicrobium parvum TaxID=2884022 RepID=A0A9E7C226_9ACTN|nr:tautomerase family protein [Capillimicrobium parvum]UGS37289.1 hypothetical protein DSM104329_03704 [Capillimicrobium parvum]